MVSLLPKHAFFFLFLNLLIGLTSAKCLAQLARPRLVVGLVVDQMRWDYLYRFSDRFSKDGFKRLMQDGYSCQNIQLDYIPAFTACGHASIFTGSVPALHGITGNEWIVRETGRQAYCTGDSSVKSVGSHAKAGEMSPKNLLVTTIGDELKLATNFRAKVIGIAIKDRGAILPAGHSADAAYWFDEATGNFITSTYYRSSLPRWADDYNKLQRAQAYTRNGWQTLYPVGTYVQSTSDDNRYEGTFPNEKQPVFPHRFDNKAPFNVLKSTPFANSMTFEFAQAAISAEGLGQDEITDMLTISLSGTDYIAHQFGPNAMETEDAYLRLDRDLAKFLHYLDEHVGTENYTFFLTADHGGAHNPNFLKDHQLPGGFWDANALQVKLNQILKDKYHVDGLVRPFLNYQLQFDHQAIAKAMLPFEELKKTCIELIAKEPGLAYAIDLSQIEGSTIPIAIKDKILNGYYPARSGMVQLIPQSGWFQLSHDETGSIHGAWNTYDSHIPLIFMGWGINKGLNFEKRSICDIAPTISALLHIQEPSGNVGRVIEGVRSPKADSPRVRSRKVQSPKP